MNFLKTITPQGRIAYLVAFCVIALDQITKAWMVYGVKLTSIGHVELSPVFDLTLVWNRGMSFGFGAAHGDLSRWGFSIFAIGIASAVAWWARTIERPLLAWTLGLLMGGAIGNVIDRLRFGAVVDFLDFSGLGFPWVFNVADSAITVGAVLIVIEAFWPAVRQRLESVRVRGN
jgi:signal peptidase II